MTTTATTAPPAETTAPTGGSDPTPDPLARSLGSGPPTQVMKQVAALHRRLVGEPPPRPGSIADEAMRRQRAAKGWDLVH